MSNPDPRQAVPAGVDTENGLARWLVRTGYSFARLDELAATTGIAPPRLAELVSGADPADAEIGTLAEALDVDAKLGESDMVIFYTGKWSMAQLLAGEDELATARASSW